MMLENTVKKAGRNFLFKAGLYTSMLAAACSGGKGGKDDPPADHCTSITQEELDDSNECTRDYCSDGMVKHDAQPYSTVRDCAEPLTGCRGTDYVTISQIGCDKA